MELQKDAAGAPVHSIVHTPGPWIVSRYAKNLVATTDDKIGIADVAMCGPWIAKPPQDQQDANARLMAESPRMLTVIEIIANATGDTDLEYAQELSQEILMRLKVV